jgi:high affinity sulfate transporter 1
MPPRLQSRRQQPPCEEPDAPRDGLRWTPGLRQLSRYRREWMRHDVLSGLVLAAVIVPVGMAYAELAGLPPAHGLYASLIPLAIYAIFGPSPAMVMGPDSATATLVGAAVIPIAGLEVSRRVGLAAMLAVLVGAMCLVVGVSRLGFVTDLLSKPVRIGYMNGIALAIIAGQLPKLFGFSVPPSENIVGAIVAFAENLWRTNTTALAIGAGGLVVILLLRYLAPKVPGPLVVVAGATIAVAALGITGIKTVGMLPRGIPLPTWPGVGLTDTLQLVVAALGVAAISLTDTAVLSRAFASRFNYSADPDEENITLGVANLAVGAFAGFPVSGSQSRTAANTAAGAKSPASGLVAGAAIVILLVAVPGLLSPVPVSVLAAVVISAVVELADIHGTVRLWHVRRTEFSLSIAAFLGVVLLGVLPGVILAVALSVMNFFRRQWWPHDAQLGRVPGVKGYHDVGDLTEAREVPGLLLYRFDAPLFFANATIFRQRLAQRMRCADPPIRRVVICAEPLIDVDTTAADAICELIDELAEDGVELAFAEVKHPVREHMDRYGIIERVGAANFYPTIGSAVHAYVRDTGVTWTDWEDESTAPLGGEQ